MTVLLVTSIEDVEKYVKEHPHSQIGLAWADMLFDMEHAGENYTVSDFLTEADAQYGDGASLADILVEGSGQ